MLEVIMICRDDKTCQTLIAQVTVCFSFN